MASANMTHIRIKEIGRIITGGTPPIKAEYFGNEYPFIKPTDIDTVTWRVEDTEVKLSQKGYDYNKRRLLPPDTTCVTLKATVGKICITTRNSFTNDQFTSVVPERNRFDPIYVYYLLRATIPKIKKIDAGSASGRDHVKKSAFESIEVEVHDLPQQRKIAVILSAYDNLIENNRRRIQLLEEIARALYREWFVHFRFPGHECVDMVASELGEIPKGWTCNILDDIAEEVRRNVNPSDLHPDTPYVGLAEIQRQSIALSNWGRAGDAGSSKLQFERGEILFGKIRPYFHKVAVPPVGGICSGDAIVVKPKASEMFGLVLSIINSDDFVAQATASSKGTKMPRADWGVLERYPVVVPESGILNRFNSFVSNSISLIHKLIFMNRNLQQKRDLLLPRLVSGRIDVSNMEIEVPTDNHQTSKSSDQSTLNQWLDGEHKE